ncbi:MAG TPA: STAS domain-containing protein [Anaerolineales bacterium]|nr:STAS domain-containing protein [Anaerolineales bacterium]
MQINHKNTGDVTVLEIVGSVDALTAPQITTYIQGLVEAGSLKLIADFGGVDYTSSAGLRVLLGAVKETRAGGGDFRLAAVRPEVLKVLTLSGFTNILKLYDDAETAVESFS